VAGRSGDAAIYSAAADKLERHVAVGEPVTGASWQGARLAFSTAKGAVRVYDGGREAGAFSEHSGAATGVSLHPSGDIAASVGADKAVVVYDLVAGRRAGRAYADSGGLGVRVMGCRGLAADFFALLPPQPSLRVRSTPTATSSASARAPATSSST
jgi:WD40 repeat protein